MMFDPDHHHRRSIRLPDFDYRSPGAYFVTICVRGRECLFGQVINEKMLSNEAGAMVVRVWNDLPAHYANVTLDAFVLMPNHIHGIIVLTDDGRSIVSDRGCPILAFGLPVGAGFKPAPTYNPDLGVGRLPGRAGLKPAPTRPHGFPEIVRGFKTFSARRINEARRTPSISVWQRNYYEYIVRNQAELRRVREYIDLNPRRWAEDPENPGAVLPSPRTTRER
jgi:putative transposase